MSGSSILPSCQACVFLSFVLGALLGDESSLSSADMLSIPNLPLDSISEEISRKRISSSDVDISKTRESRYNLSFFICCVDYLVSSCWVSSISR